jgi:hypothetical protein
MIELAITIAALSTWAFGLLVQAKCCASTICDSIDCEDSVIINETTATVNYCAARTVVDVPEKYVHIENEVDQEIGPLETAYSPPIAKLSLEKNQKYSVLHSFSCVQSSRGACSG